MSNLSTTQLLSTPLFPRELLNTASDHYIRASLIISNVYRTASTEADYSRIVPTLNGNTLISDFHAISGELVSYQDLEDGWDGYDGIAPDDSTVALAFNFLSDLSAEHLKMPKLMVSGAGEISFFWKDKTTNTYLEVQFDSGEYYSFFIDNNGDVSGQDDIDFHTVGVSKDIIYTLKNVYNFNFTLAA